MGSGADHLVKSTTRTAYSGKWKLGCHSSSRVFLPQRHLCSISAVILVFVVNHCKESQTYRRYDSTSKEFGSSIEKKKKKIHSDVRKCSVALLHLLKKQKRSNHYKDGTVQAAWGRVHLSAAGTRGPVVMEGTMNRGPDSQAHLKTRSRARKPRQCWTGFREQIPQSP